MTASMHHAEGAPELKDTEPSGAWKALPFRAPLALLAPSLLLVCGLLLYPLVRLVVLSLFDPGLTFANYVSVVRDPTLWRIILITLEIAVECTLATLVLGYPLAGLLASQSGRTARIMMLAVMLPFWTSILVRMYAWMVLLGRHGIINDTLLASGLLGSPLPLLYNRLAVILGMSQYLLPFMVLSLYSTMVRIDRSVLEAADTMGSTQSQKLARIYIPLTLPGVYTGSLLVFILCLGFYVTPALLGGPSDTTIPVYIEQQTELLNWGQATAMSVVLLAVVILLFILYSKLVGFDQAFTRVKAS